MEITLQNTKQEIFDAYVALKDAVPVELTNKEVIEKAILLTKEYPFVHAKLKEIAKRL